MDVSEVNNAKDNEINPFATFALKFKLEGLDSCL